MDHAPGRAAYDASTCSTILSPCFLASCCRLSGSSKHRASSFWLVEGREGSWKPDEAAGGESLLLCLFFFFLSCLCLCLLLSLCVSLPLLLPSLYVPALAWGQRETRAPENLKAQRERKGKRTVTQSEGAACSFTSRARMTAGRFGWPHIPSNQTMVDRMGAEEAVTVRADAPLFSRMAPT